MPEALLIDEIGKECHLIGILRVEKDCFREEARDAARIQRDCWDERNSLGWVAWLNGRVIGFVSGMLDLDNDYFKLHWIAVDPLHQRRGIGRCLIMYAVREVSRLRYAGIQVYVPTWYPAAWSFFTQKCVCLVTLLTMPE